MKKLFYSTVVLLTLTMTVSFVSAATIHTGSITGSFCSGASLSVPYTASGLGSSNVFTVQLSNASGSFLSPVKLGTLKSKVSGTITVNIPAKQASGTAYRIRVVGSSPSTTGTNNGSNLIISLVTVSVSSNSPVCAGSGLNLVSNAPARVSYAWSGPNGFSFNGSAPSLPSAVTADSGIYTVTVANSTGCVATANAHVVVNAPMQGYINGATTICSGSMGVLTACPAKSYMWSTGTTTSSIAVSATGGYSVQLTSTTGCTSSASKNMTVMTSPAPVITAQPSLNFCAGDSVLLCLNNTYSNYTWSNGAGSSCFFVNSSGTYSVTVTDNNGCSGTASAQTIMNQRGSPQVTINENGSTSYCTGNTVAFNAAPINGGTAPVYHWFLNNLPVGNTGSTFTNSLLTAGVNKLTCTMVSNSGCSSTNTANSNEIDFNVVNTPVSSTIQGETAGNCAGTSHSFSIPSLSDGSIYTWTLTGDVTIANGAGTNSVQLNFGSQFTSGTLSVTTSNTCGTSPASTVTVNSTPVIPGPIQGPAGGVCDAMEYYTVTPADDISTYSWTFPANTTLEGATVTNNEILLAFNNGFTTGTLTVMATNGCGSSGGSSSLSINALPSDAGAIDGPKAVCPYTFDYFSISPEYRATSYQWTAPAGATIQGGQGTETASVGFSPNFSGGTLSVYGVDACGNGSTSTMTLTKSKSCRIEKEEVQQSENITIYPNPAHDFLNIAFTAKSNAPYTVSMRDITGRVIMEQVNNADEGINVIQVDIGAFSKGLYFLSLSGEAQSKQTKITVN